MNETIIAPDEPKNITNREKTERKSVIEKSVEQFDLLYQKWEIMDKRLRNSFIQFQIETFYSTAGRFLNNDIANAILRLDWVNERKLTVETNFEKNVLTVIVNL
ncbi:MAG: hypothetical protein P1P85_03920 [Patescibacteria group bacterium]|nr:hypothetical protein [Patescibacteria group bacterium]